MMMLKFDRKQYAAVVVDRHDNPYAFERKSHERFLTARDDYVFDCFQIRKDGTLNTNFSIPIKKKDLDDRFVNIK